jgi:DNA phosphorothioation-dependent restriction protein DptH
MPLSAGAVEAVWQHVLEGRLLDEVAQAEPGQCLRVDGLPRTLLEETMRRLHAAAPAGVAVSFVDRVADPAEPWRVGVHKVVEQRNRGDLAVLAAFPPDLKLAAGDSVDVSTFREIPTADLSREIEELLMEQVPEPLRAGAGAVLDDLDRRKLPVAQNARHEFLALIAQQDRAEPWVVGASVFVLGLIPDLALVDRPEQIALRIGQRNLPAVDALSASNGSGTLLGRILRLPVRDAAFRERLRRLLTERPGGPRQWGAAIATEPAWQDLTLDRWPFSDQVLPPGGLRIDLNPLRLPRRKDDGLPVYDPSSKLVVSWKTTPPPAEVPGLATFRVELLTSDRVVVWETPLIKRGTGKTANRNRTIKGLADLASGIHFFRVSAYTESGDPFPEQPPRDPEVDDGKRTNESEDFLLLAAEDLGDTDLTPVSTSFVIGFTEAELLARAAALAARRDPATVRVTEIAWDTGVDAPGEIARATLHFDAQRQYTVSLSQRLRRVELGILGTPDDGGHRRLALSRQQSELEAIPLALPAAFAEARRDVFAAISGTAITDDAKPVVALADLCTFADRVEAYAREYRAWLQTGAAEPLLVDVVRVQLSEGVTLGLVAPTHPLRLLWSLQEQEASRSWTRTAAQQPQPPSPRDLVATFRSSFAAQGIPALLVLQPNESYMDAGPLPGNWAAYLPPRLRDSRSILSILRTRLGAGAAHESEGDIQPGMLADKFEAFVRQHPYTPSLVINVVNPGDGALVRDALIALEDRLVQQHPALRFDVRLFAADASTDVVGQAFRDLMDPDRQVSEAAARLAGPGQSFLFPKLSWSRKPLRRLLDEPERFPAHVTLILDAFPVALSVARVDPDDRTSFVHGLVQEAPRRFAGRGDSYRWERRPAPRPCLELPNGPDRSVLIAELVAGIGATQAALLTVGANPPAGEAITAVSALDLTSAGQSLLYAGHAVSTWVLTLDSNLGLDYFDSAGRVDRPGYLLDFTPEFVASGGRQLLLTTRASEEIIRLVAPTLERLGIDRQGSGPRLLVEALRSLSGRLTLRLLSAPSQAQGVLGMALSRLFLEAHDLLSDSVVVPLDAHSELAAGSDSSEPALRGDLLVISADTTRRHLDFLLVEAKCHRGTGLSGELRGRIRAQLGASERRLQELFKIRDENDRVDRAVRSWQLSTVLGFYLDRAQRYGLVSPDASPGLRRFFADLDAGYSLSVRKVGLVFRLDADETRLDQSDPELPVWIVGVDVVERLLKAAMREFAETSEATSKQADDVEARPLEHGLVASTRSTEPTWEEVRRTLRGAVRSAPATGQPGGPPADIPQSPPTVTTAAPTSADDPRAGGELVWAPGPAAAPSRPEPAGPAVGDSTPPEITHSDAGRLIEKSTATGPAFDVLLGNTRATRQYGLLATAAAEPWRTLALDLDGCNTVSVFGVQGGGKSYTLGSIIEMAARPIAGVNRLPKPLATVVFHYHQTQDYPPEFVSMREANEEPEEVRELQAMGGEPAALADVVIVTTADTVELRRAEFPGITVEPLAFSSSELTVADWRFLMGATGNDALYLKLVNEVMRQHRGRLELEVVRQGLHEAPLSDAQRVLAITRLDFASRFIDDAASLRRILHPGRLVIVDLRDEFIEREQALGLFVTMLNVFSGAGMGPDGFNKLIVFDEAHKYMGGPLIGQVVEVIREMRHKGVSVVVASQDPVNVPSPVIELSSAVVLHRFNSPSWLRHIQKSLTALADLTPAALNSLQPGEAFIWANKATEPVFTRRAVKVRMRPRATKHGGSTRTALT